MKLLSNFVSTYSGMQTRYSLRLQKPAKKWTLMLPGAGCEYWKRTGGCTMCGFNNATQKYTHGHRYPSLVFDSFFKLADWHSNSNPEELVIFNGGNFWNNDEMPIGFQEKICKRVAEHPSLQTLLIENRCEYITAEKIKTAKKMLGEKRLKVAIGFESQDDYVRNKLIRKGLSKKTFEEKVKLLKDNGADVFAYIFLKPLGLSEGRALEETIATIKYAISIGVDEMDISCAFIQAGTVMAEKYGKGEFTPPRLWTVLEIINQIQKNNWPVNIGGFDDEPPPLAIPANCESCSTAIYEAIEKFRRTRVLGKIPDCSCKKKWEKEISLP